MINFSKYDEENPQIWREFERLSIITKQKGFQRYSAKGIFELIRWHTGVSGNDRFKINNNYTADYARKMEQHHPEFVGWFVKRQLKSLRGSNNLN